MKFNVEFWWTEIERVRAKGKEARFDIVRQIYRLGYEKGRSDSELITLNKDTWE